MTRYDHIVRVYEEALEIAKGERQADTSTPGGLLAYLASRYSTDAADMLAKLRQHSTDVEPREPQADKPTLAAAE